MKINRLQSRKGAKILETAAHDSIFRSKRLYQRQGGEPNLVLRPEP